MNLIIETDCGHDPDDFFTLCYLVSAGVNIRCIVVTPGDIDQLAIVSFFCEQVGLDIPIGASKVSIKHSSGSIHHALLKKYGKSIEACKDGMGKDIIKSTLDSFPDSELFIIGPPSNVRQFFEENPDAKFGRATMQGGFCGYHVYEPKIKVAKFEGQTWVPTFNMNGDVKGAQALMKANIGTRQFCGKNVCHSVFYDKSVYDLMSKPRDRASELFMEGMEILLSNKEGKKFHDPVAAVCHLHPEIGTWVKGKVQKVKGGWETIPDDNGDDVLVDLDREAFWNHIRNWN
jgi:inosine-uridine nucleoside N-ribohydrolase